MLSRNYKFMPPYALIIGLFIFTAACGPVQFSALSTAQSKSTGPALPYGANSTPPGTTPGGGGTVPSYTYRCGGPADASLYTGNISIVKAQSQQFYNSYSECQAARASLFANSMVCSKVVASTILGCQMTADFTHVVLEMDLALPIFKSTQNMEVPYDYYLLGVPNCEVAKNYVNSLMNANVATLGNFTTTRASIRTDCVNSTDMVIHVLSLY